MSGRGLAHTGGTIDKLESIVGWRSELSDAAFLEQARQIGLALAGQSKNLAPADGLLYALRDVTATVDCLPLIASSIMSKKLASGAHTIILDVKVGQGAFMKTLESARELAREMVSIGQREGRQVRAVLTDMGAPLGHWAGNSLEVKEAIETLRGRGPSDLTELCVALTAEALQAYGAEPSEAERRAREVLSSGAALEKFRAFIAAQGGDINAVDHPETLDVAPDCTEVYAPQTGYVTQLDALKVGQAVLALGGGREHKGEAIDHGVGVQTPLKPGDFARAGSVLARIYHRNGRGLAAAQRLLGDAFTLADVASSPTPLILERVN